MYDFNDQMDTEIILKAGIKPSVAKPVGVKVARVGEVTFFLSSLRTPFCPQCQKTTFWRQWQG